MNAEKHKSSLKRYEVETSWIDAPGYGSWVPFDQASAIEIERDKLKEALIEMRQYTDKQLADLLRERVWLREQVAKWEEWNTSLKDRISELEAERQWRPIGTAPKTTETMLVAWIETGKNALRINWAASGNRLSADSNLWQVLDDYSTPTHWMPLPEAPKP